jgi:DUF4097 and DUF4098 domain-containing protein YvlB
MQTPLTALSLAIGLGLTLFASSAFAAILVVGPGEDGDTASQSIEVPAGISAGNMDTASGSVRVRAGARVRVIDTASGSVELETAAQADSVDTASGSVRLGPKALVLGRIDVASGSVTLGPGASSGVIDTGSGGVDIGDSAVCRDIDTGSGSVTVGRAATTGGIDTGSGSVTVNPGARVLGAIDTGSGSVRATGATLQRGIDTGSGNITLSATVVSGDIYTTNGDVQLSVGTRVNGNLTVREKSCGGWFSFGCESRPTKVVIESGVSIGNITLRENVVLYVHPSARIGRVIGGERKTYQAEAQ